MPFVVVNTVKADKEQLPAIALAVQTSGLDHLREQPGFRRAQLLTAEDGSELLLVIEWDDREAFMAYRHTEAGRSSVEAAARFHPHISFYQEIVSHHS